MPSLHKRMTVKDRMEIIVGLVDIKVRIKSIYDDLGPIVDLEFDVSDESLTYGKIPPVRLRKGEMYFLGTGFGENIFVKFAGLDRSRGGYPRAKMVFSADKRVKFEFVEGK